MLPETRSAAKVDTPAIGGAVYEKVTQKATIRIKILAVPQQADHFALHEFPVALGRFRSVALHGLSRWPGQARDGELRLGLQDDYLLLNALGDELGQRFFDLGLAEKGSPVERPQPVHSGPRVRTSGKRGIHQAMGQDTGAGGDRGGRTAVFPQIEP